MRMCSPGRTHLEQHYEDLSSKPFFASLIDYMSSGPVIAMVWEGMDVVLAGRKMLGATKPFDSEPGTIRGDYAIDIGRNIIHGSDAVASARHEIGLWFPEGVTNYEHTAKAWIYE